MDIGNDPQNIPDFVGQIRQQLSHIFQRDNISFVIYADAEHTAVRVGKRTN